LIGGPMYDILIVSETLQPNKVYGPDLTVRTVRWGKCLKGCRFDQVLLLTHEPEDVVKKEQFKQWCKTLQCMIKPDCSTLAIFNALPDDEPLITKEDFRKTFMGVPKEYHDDKPPITFDEWLTHMYSINITPKTAEIIWDKLKGRKVGE